MRYSRAQIVDGTGFAEGQQFETVEDYNGWANRETWAVALYINNDQGWQESVLDALRAETERLAEKESDDYALSAWRAGEIVRECVEAVFDPEAIVGLGIDGDSLRSLLLARDDIGSMWRVNWDEVGAAFLTDLRDES